MTDIIEKGRALFAALQAGDVEALRQLLAPDFRGELTPGLPNGLGRIYEGFDAMLRDGWGRVGEAFDMHPEPDRFIDGGDVLIVHGYYVGTVRSTGRPVRADFAHFWSFDGARFTGVKQVTDSGAWRDGLGPAASIRSV